MAITNHDRVGKALELLKGGLGPYVEREFSAKYKDKTPEAIARFMTTDRLNTDKPIAEWDAAALLKLMWDSWNDIFRYTLGHAERSLVSELRDSRNKWAHQQTFSGDDAFRVLDSTGRLLSAVSAAQQVDEIEKIKNELLRQRFDEQVRRERRKAGGSLIEAATGTLKPWRSVVTPHADVASGRYQSAEFAADLWQVHLGEGVPEYRDPTEFFRRTYLTESLKRLLIGAVQRMAGQGGDPVIQLQTNFGGGKTHSMLALYHLFSGTPASELPGADALLAEAGITELGRANRVVLVGNKISPGSPITKSDGTIVRTLWGELAWQLGEAAGGPQEAKRAFQRVAADDENATSPGDQLRRLFNDYGPCVILIDEWVAYARQLHDESDLPAGSFGTQFSFAQVLTESAKLAKNCLLVISLPASDMTGSPHASADDVEVGGVRGREALDRLRNVVGRLESSWRPATAEEGFEIVRRRLFEPFANDANFTDRDVVARAFTELYRSQHQEFPPECREADYEKRIKAAYPIHPEIFDRLYTDWSTLVKFQRTRGVLRLMASVIHSLWQKGDQNPLILPASIPIDDPPVMTELTRYLSDNWAPVIEKDVDGPNSLPMRIDGEVPNLGKYSACRRVARTIYLGSAPTADTAHQGIEDRRVKLGCVMPGESPAVFGDGLRRLAAAATYLYQDGQRFWYSTRPTVTKLAEDRAEQLKRSPDKIAQELEKRLRQNVREKGDFSGVHPLPQTGQDVPDDLDTRMVVLGIDHSYSRTGTSAAEVAAKEILESRGSSPRQYRNTLVFLAADKVRLQDLDEAARRFLAWESILAEKERLDMTPHQVKQAEGQKAAADGMVTARLPETYQWLLVPSQEKEASSPINWDAIALRGTEPLAVRASKKLRSEELLVTSLAGSILRIWLDKIPLWRGNHVDVKQLAEDFAKYLYLPRLQAPSILVEAIRDGVSALMWRDETFAFADRFDAETKRYIGLKCGRNILLTDFHAPGLVVKPDVANTQIEVDAAAATANSGSTTPPSTAPVTGGTSGPATGEATGTSQPPAGESGTTPTPPPQPKRFHGTVELNSARLGLEASKIADEVVAHLAGLVGAQVRVSLEIEASVPNGVPENVVRIVTENSKTLKFGNQGFEKE